MLIDYFKEHNLPCSCPFSAGEYSAQNLSLDIDLDFKIPAGETKLLLFEMRLSNWSFKIGFFFFVRSGAYNIIANFLTNDLGHVGCLNINVDIV